MKGNVVSPTSFKLLPCIIVYTSYCFMIFTESVSEEAWPIWGRRKVMIFPLNSGRVVLLKIHKYFMMLEDENITREFSNRFLVVCFQLLSVGF